MGGQTVPPFWKFDTNLPFVKPLYRPFPPFKMASAPRQINGDAFQRTFADSHALLFNPDPPFFCRRFFRRLLTRTEGFLSPFLQRWITFFFKPLVELLPRLRLFLLVADPESFFWPPFFTKGSGLLSFPAAKVPSPLGRVRCLHPKKKDSIPFLQIFPLACQVFFRKSPFFVSLFPFFSLIF